MEKFEAKHNKPKDPECRDSTDFVGGKDDFAAKSAAFVEPLKGLHRF